MEALPSTASLASIAGFLKAIRLYPFPGKLPVAEARDAEDPENSHQVEIQATDAIPHILEIMTTMLSVSTKHTPETTTVCDYLQTIQMLDDDFAVFIFYTIFNNQCSSPPLDSLVSILRQLAFVCASLPLTHDNLSPVPVRQMVHFLAFQPLNSRRPLCHLSPFQLSVLIDTNRSASLDFETIYELPSLFRKYPGQWLFNSVKSAYAFDDDDYYDRNYEASLATKNPLVIFRHCKYHTSVSRLLSMLCVSWVCSVCRITALCVSPVSTGFSMRFL